jgi:hypothetical protein
MGHPSLDVVKTIADIEFEKQKSLFRRENRQQLSVHNDIWQLFYLTGPNLRSNSYDFSKIHCVSLRLELKYFMLWYLQGRSDYRTPVLAAVIKGVNFLSSNNPSIHYFADISDVDARQLYNYLENDCFSQARRQTVHQVRCQHPCDACGQIIDLPLRDMRDPSLRTPIPTGIHLQSTAFSIWTTCPEILR